MIFSRQSFLSEKTFQFHELFYYKIAFQMKTFILSIIVTMITSVAGAQQKVFMTLRSRLLTEGLATFHVQG